MKNNRTPTIESTATNEQSHSNTLSIGSERQYRFLLAIIGAYQAINHLIQIVGANNIPDIASKLRKRGWIIHMDMIPVFDRDGNKVDAGCYKLDHTQVEQAKDALRAWREKHPIKAA